ncbi:hypothetical protein [Streptomyces massasporeus]|uniref:hypothetical protein n=1 Tax=Streptomyces massasporeus TaxID=67324 RepID=UPI0016726569|nr:hypothetical protein [Streptomyces massasporeus]GGV89962.1 hypothetical protein GCM10010228_77350 [Streptomyces massasporeus]
MQSDDKPINGQPNPNFLDLLAQTPEPPDEKEWPRPKRFAGLREAWDASWKQGGFLYESGVPTGSLSGRRLMLSHLSR